MQQNPVSKTEHSKCIRHISRLYNIPGTRKIQPALKRKDNWWGQTQGDADEENIKAAVTVLSEIKENIPKINTKAGNFNRETETQKTVQNEQKF